MPRLLGLWRNGQLRLEELVSQRYELARTGTGSQPPRRSSRGKREDILAVATTLFGRDGYEDSKWADVASAVGIGSTALYHYFESKLHCLYVIMAEALATYLQNFERITKESADYPTAIVSGSCSAPRGKARRR